LQEGWNLIGYYGNTGLYVDSIYQSIQQGPMECEIASKPVYCALNSLVDTQQGFPRWSSLYNYFNYGSNYAGWVGLDACCNPIEFDSWYMGTWCPYSMEPGKGYWIEMDVGDGYAPATNCMWNEDMHCLMPFV